nr:MAG TPA: hypothetical protein [Caudoviricetes sp.]
MKMYKRDVFKEETVKVLNELMIDNLLVQQVIEKILKVANINDPDVDEIMKVLNSRVRDTNKLIEGLKEMCKEEVL